MGYIAAAIIAGLFSVIVVVLQNRANRALKSSVQDVHEEVRTNHGIRQGQRIEDLGVDVAWIRGQMVTKQELADHAALDLTTKQELLAAIGAKEK